MATSHADLCCARVLLNIELQQALADRNRSLAHNGHDGETYERRGWLWLRLDNPAKALADFGKALSNGGVVDLSMYGRAVANERPGQTAAAKAAFTQARGKIRNIDSVAAQKGLVLRSAVSAAQDRMTAELLARVRVQ